MTRYCVNATMTAPAWIYVEADTPEEALEYAREHTASAYETDNGAAEIAFDVTPVVEVAP